LGHTPNIKYQTSNIKEIRNWKLDIRKYSEYQTLNLKPQTSNLMKPTKRMTRRQMLRQADKVVKSISHNRELFQALPVDLPELQQTLTELYEDFAGNSFPKKVMSRLRKMESVKEQLKDLEKYMKKLKVES
jgi:hypothetical protein